MRGLVAGLLFVMCGFSAWAEEVKPVPVYQVERAKSSLKFSVIVNGAPTKGFFENFESDIAFDPERLKESHIRMTVDTGSAKLADAKMQADLLSLTWLGAEKFPKAVFETQQIDRIPGTQDFYAKGTLSLRGKKQPVNLNFRVDYHDDSVAVASGFVTIQRNAFDVGQDEWKADDKVKFAVRVEFRIHASKKK